MVEEKMLKVSSDIKENRLLKEFAFNEMIVLNTINHYKEISFKELCKKTNMLKSLLIVSNDIEDKRLKKYIIKRKKTTLNE